MPDGLPINEFVLPMVEAKLGGDGYVHVTRYRGTGFLIGSRGALVTAGHVVEEAQEELAVLTPNADGDAGSEWRVWSLTSVERHPSEDVAIGLVALDTVPASPLRISPEPQYGSAPWMVWGYPEDVMREYVVDDRAVVRPELVYVSGYIRRRIPRFIDIPKVQGEDLYESGGVAGAGCSGAPVISARISDQQWPVIGVYLGQRVVVEEGVFVSYAAAFDRAANWTPEVLGCSILDESHT